MPIEQFINSYSAEYMFIFHGEKKSIETKKESTLDKISKFLFEPRYEVNNLKFKTVAVV